MNKIKISHILNILICILPLGFQISSIINNANIYRFIYILIILTGLISVFSKNDFFISIKGILFLMIISIVYFIFPSLSFNMHIDTISYYIFIICFIIVTYISGYILTKYKRKVLKRMKILSGSLLFYQILININQITFESLIGVFTGDRFHRAQFGYSHANFAAMFIVFEILLVYFNSKENKKYKFAILEGAFWMISLLATGSRSAVYSLGVFFISETIFYISRIFKQINKLVYVMIVIILINLAVVYLGEDIMANSSGRDVQIKNNMEVMINEGSVLFGNGGGRVSKINENEGIRFSDNWYMTSIINSGICGLILMLSTIIYIFIRIFKNIKKDTIIVSFYIMMFIYSLSENMLFVPGVLLSWFLWTYTMSVMVKDRQIDQYENRLEV